MASDKKMVYTPPQYIQDRPPVPDAGWLLDWYLAQHREAFNHWTQDANPTWRASSLGNCLRQQTLARRGIPGTRSIDAKTQRAFAWGDEVHKFIRKVYWRLGVVIDEETELKSEDLHIVGHSDLIWTPGGFTRPDEEDTRAKWSDDWNIFLTALRTLYLEEVGNFATVPLDEVIGSEFKSAHSMAMKRMLNDGPHEHHKAQVAAYYLMAKEHPDALISSAERWFLTYVGKDSVGTLSFEMEDAWVEDAQQRLHDLNRFWSGGVLPPCSCQGWQVDYCTYAEGTLCCGRNLKGQVARALRKVEAHA
jgi:CRISPR/Cas system-associated exonuclease Cas4 (RecB family)